MKAVFDGKRASKIFSADLLAALVSDEEAPWATWNRGKPMSPRQLSSKLADFGIKTTTVRAGFDVKKGYHLEQFADAFGRYLSATEPFLSVTPPSQSVTPLQPSNDAASSVTNESYSLPTEEGKVTRKATTGAGCNDVTDSAPPNRKERGEAPPLWDESDTEEL
ncbi:MAG: hypothetical protein GAK36_00185 [Pseudomonas sp.]|nr:MAG: hypothetical protein GAK36_00185 [Pseudomonas sp.]